MRKFFLTLLSVALLACLAAGGLSFAAAEEDAPIRVSVSAYDMRAGTQFAWQANAEDEFAVFTGATDCNTGETNDVILQVTMPVAGTVSFADGGTVAKITSGAGDGARLRLVHNGTQRFPADKAWQRIEPDGTSVVVKPAEFSVAAGDRLYLIFDNGGAFSNASDSVWYCLGFKLNGNWFGSNEYWYATAEEGEAEVTYAGVTCKKNELIAYRYGRAADDVQGPAADESAFATVDLGTLVPTVYDEAEMRFKGSENPSCQFEPKGMNVVAGIPGVIAMEMSADGLFAVQHSYFKLLSGAEAKAEVLKNDKLVFSAELGASFATVDGMPTVRVAAGDTVFVRVTSAAGAYLRYEVNGVLATADGLVCYGTLDSVAGGGGNCTFFTTKPREELGDPTRETLKPVAGVNEEPMVYSARDGRWGGREAFCLTWKEANGLKVHTGATYCPAVGYEVPAAGKARIANLSVKVESNLSDGVKFRILKKTAATGAYAQLYPLDAAWQTVLFEGDVENLASEIVSVAAGDRLIVVIHPSGTNSNDQTDVSFDAVFQPEGGDIAVANAVSGFATEQSGAWKYLDMIVAADYSSTKVGAVETRTYQSLDKSKMKFDEMTYFSTLGRWGIAGRSFLQIENGSLHPGEIYAAAIGITMPAKGRVDLSDTVFKYDLHATPDADGDKSDGVRIRVLRNNDVIWPLDGGWQEIADDAEKTFDIPVFSVERGDILYVVVDCGAAGKNNYDLTYVSILAHFAEDGSDWTNTFDSKASFVESDPNYEAFSYWSYYYDTSGGGSDDDDDGKGGEGKDPTIEVEKGGCGGSLAADALPLGLALLALGLAAVKLAGKRA